MTLQQRLQAFAQAVAADIKSLFAKQGNLANLSTTEKSNLVGAINEVKSAVGGSAVINDTTASTTSTYSSSKIDQKVAGIKSDILGGASSALDTLKEIEDRITADGNSAAALTTAVGNRVSYTQADNRTAAEKQQARTNIDAYGSVELGNPDTDLVAVYNTAKA